MSLSQRQLRHRQQGSSRRHRLLLNYHGFSRQLQLQHHHLQQGSKKLANGMSKHTSNHRQFDNNHQPSYLKPQFSPQCLQQGRLHLPLAGQHAHKPHLVDSVMMDRKVKATLRHTTKQSPSTPPPGTGSCTNTNSSTDSDLPRPPKRSSSKQQHLTRTRSPLMKQ